MKLNNEEIFISAINLVKSLAKDDMIPQIPITTVNFQKESLNIGSVILIGFAVIGVIYTFNTVLNYLNERDSKKNLL